MKINDESLDVILLAFDCYIHLSFSKMVQIFVLEQPIIRVDKFIALRLQFWYFSSMELKSFQFSVV